MVFHEMYFCWCDDIMLQSTKNELWVKRLDDRVMIANIKDAFILRLNFYDPITKLHDEES